MGGPGVFSSASATELHGSAPLKAAGGSGSTSRIRGSHAKSPSGLAGIPLWHSKARVRSASGTWQNTTCRCPATSSCTLKLPAHCSARENHARSEEHTSELQSHSDLVCRLLLEKKKAERYNTLTWDRLLTSSSRAFS